MKRKFYKWTLIVTLFFTSAVQQGYSEPEALFEQVKRIFPEAHSIQTTDVSEYLIFNQEQQKIGRALLSSPSADQIVGYFGPVPLLIGIDLKENIVTVLLLENRETPSYVEQVISSGLLSKWDGLSKDEALKKEVDVISGATLTSRAVIRTFQKRVSDDIVSNSGSTLPWIFLLGGVVLLGVFYYFFKSRRREA